jgi:hypothetical protein
MEPGGQVSRRQALKRVAAAGAVVWAAPVVQSLNMSRAYAGSRVCYSIAFGGESGNCYILNTNNHQCDLQPLYASVPTACDHNVTVNRIGAVYGSHGEKTWIVTIPAGCVFVAGWTHGGSHSECEQNATPVGGPASNSSTIVTFYPNSGYPGDGRYAISNVELTYCC